MMDVLQGLMIGRHDAENAARLAFTASGLIFGCCELVMTARGDAAVTQQRREDLLAALQLLLK